VAEDNPVNQTLAVRLLEKQGHQVQLANNGVEAVRAWMAEGHFDAILMDVDMPLMNGHEATRRIRAVEASEAAGQHIPIIAMTAHAMEGARESCLRSGMDGYLSKPIVTDLLWRELERATSHLAPPPRIPGPAVDGPPDPAPATAAPDVADFARMRETLGDDAALFEELRAQFLSDAPRLLAQARAALARADAPQLAASAHAIKGVVAIFAAQGCVDACVRIEQEAASPSAGTALTALAGRLQTLQDAVARYRW
jgi:two-component system sensor histidine kinase/response regulator